MSDVLVHRSPSGITLQIAPERGAKITSLRDATGREWLHTSERPGIPGVRFGDAEMAGWDECAPTITACVVDGRALPDHGDLWDVPWERDADGLSAAGASWPYRLTRRIVDVPGGVRLDYRAEATTTEAVPLLWTGHPQFAAPPGTRVAFDEPPHSVVDVIDPSWPSQPWHGALAEIDTVAPGRYRKFYVHPDEAVDTATVIRPDGGRLRLSWSAPYVALWLDHGAFADGPVIAVEPSLAFADSLAVAVTRGTAPVVGPGALLEWWVEIAAPAH